MLTQNVSRFPGRVCAQYSKKCCVCWNYDHPKEDKLCFKCKEDKEKMWHVFIVGSYFTNLHLGLVFDKYLIK